MARRDEGRDGAQPERGRREQALLSAARAAGLTRPLGRRMCLPVQAFSAARTRKTYATQEEAFEAANIVKRRLDVAEPVQDQTLTLKQAFTRSF
jgi:hypothetical protein